MVRHLAIDAMKRSPPLSIKDPTFWIEQYVAGHRDTAGKSVNVSHAQLSYIPLPSIGHHHTDPAIRRVMVVAPIGDDAIPITFVNTSTAYVSSPSVSQISAVRYSCAERTTTMLHRFTHNRTGDHQGYNRWASATPVNLPGYDDRKPEKTRKLIEKALAQSGVDQPCEFNWSSFSYFPKMLPAYGQDNRGRQRGHIRPGYLVTIQPFI